MSKTLFACLALYSLSSCMVHAQESPLDSMRSELIALRSHAEDSPETRGATPALTAIKHHLRDWVEQQLQDIPQESPAEALNARIHSAVQDAGLFCDERCFPSYLGYLDEIQVSREAEYVIVQTAVGIRCGYDHSFYVYRPAPRSGETRSSAWERVFEFEQEKYSKKAYLPQTVHSVHLAQRHGGILILMLGSKPGCASAFQDVYYRLWSVNVNGAPGVKPKLLLSRAEYANIGEDPPIVGRVTANEAVIEFQRGGIGWGSAWNTVRRFAIQASGVKQTGPTVLTIRDFVDQWLASPQDARRSGGRAAQAEELEAWYRRLNRHGNDLEGYGDFPGVPTRCVKDPELFQLPVRLNNTQEVTYFLVRWRKPFEFGMEAISEVGFADCSEPDPEAGKRRSLVTSP